MRVALAHRLFNVTGGAEVFFWETDRILREAGHETLMIATGTPAKMEGAEKLILKAPDYDSPSTVRKILDLPASIYDPAKRKIIRRAFEQFKPDVLQIFSLNVHLSPALVFAAVDLDIPIVGSFNDYRHICPNYKLFHHDRICFDCKPRRFFNAVKNNCCKESMAISMASMAEAYVHKWMRVYERFDHFTFSSQFMARTTQEFWPHREISWSTFRNPFNSSIYRAEDVYEPYGLYFGRVIEEKGVDRLIKAAALIDGFPVKIIGDGPQLKELQEYVAREGITNVEFLGAMWGEELDLILSRARFVVVPSIWHENFPYVINQSFAFGRPVIGSHRGGITELVSDGERGLVVEPDDIDSIAAAMRRLATDEGEARRLGRAAKIWSDAQFSDETAHVNLMSAYRTTIDAHSTNRR
ncbi:glycosyltransferase [Sphingomonas sp.]|uniref:glycosyltransferase n=1 Tax=Sphingomonas sp. TaxID=28214 RepID=UPI002ED8CFF7